MYLIISHNHPSFQAFLPVVISALDQSHWVTGQNWSHQFFSVTLKLQALRNCINHFTPRFYGAGAAVPWFLETTYLPVAAFLFAFPWKGVMYAQGLKKKKKEKGVHACVVFFFFLIFKKFGNNKRVPRGDSSF